MAHNATAKPAVASNMMIISHLQMHRIHHQMHRKCIALIHNAASFHCHLSFIKNPVKNGFNCSICSIWLEFINCFLCASIDRHICHPHVWHAVDKLKSAVNLTQDNTTIKRVMNSSFHPLTVWACVHESLLVGIKGWSVYDRAGYNVPLGHFIYNLPSQSLDWFKTPKTKQTIKINKKITQDN